ncbi:ribonuclease P protein component [Acaryochloris thomasi]|uniref:ribonuclease P protein component n=1 Tax=Acaryochloris thomasi TaxID=2929456 RepID=UPI000DA6666F|nr:ribonuclease P protein component [Acaryochloris thomasi]
MLSKLHRLRKTQDFLTVYQRGYRRNSADLSLRVYRRPHAQDAVSPTRIGISISQKVSKRAVVRNRLKRQLRAACSQLLPQIKPGQDIVLVVRSTALQCSYQQFLQQLKQLFTQAEILHGH